MNNSDNKVVYLLGTLKDRESEGKALLKLDKLAFDENYLASLSATDFLTQDQYFHNDIYHKYFLGMSTEFSKI